MSLASWTFCCGGANAAGGRGEVPRGSAEHTEPAAPSGAADASAAGPQDRDRGVAGEPSTCLPIPPGAEG